MYFNDIKMVAMELNAKEKVLFCIDSHNFNISELMTHADIRDNII